MDTQKNLDAIEAAREAVEIAAGRIRTITAGGQYREAEGHLDDAANAIQDAFDDAVGLKESELLDQRDREGLADVQEMRRDYHARVL